jgi:hypothetical protein
MSSVKIKLLPNNFNAELYQECRDIKVVNENIMFIGRLTVRSDDGWKLSEPLKINTTVPYIMEEPE